MTQSASSSFGLHRLLLLPNLNELRREMITHVLPRYHKAFCLDTHSLLVNQLHFSEPELTTYLTASSSSSSQTQSIGPTLVERYATNQPRFLHACWIWLLLGLAQYDLEYRAMLFAAGSGSGEPIRSVRFMEEVLRVTQSFLNGTDEIALLFDDLSHRSKLKEIDLTKVIDHLSFFLNTL